MKKSERLYNIKADVMELGRMFFPTVCFGALPCKPDEDITEEDMEIILDLAEDLIKHAKGE